ncbi:Hypothetical protein GSB_153623 [Giardia duodenalis]|uniref:Uncharacterized protein n=1 Tax=Giardia intestinalis TaxID=5741 RepID=V6TZ55_GIAIN|nr:Hypothetical protein GSB_153623 [Giardia intestinalis]
MQLASSIIAKMMAQLPPQTDSMVHGGWSAPELAANNEDQSSNKIAKPALPPRSSVCTPEMHQNAPQSGSMYPLPSTITVRECMAAIQPEFPSAATLYQLLTFCNSSVLSVHAFDDSFPYPTSYVCDIKVYRLRLARHCLRIQSQRYKEAISKLIERKRAREESLRLLQNDFSLGQHSDANQLRKYIIRMSKEIVFVYLQSNCKLARLRRIMLRSLAEVNRKAVALIALYKLMPSQQESQCSVPTGDLLPASGDWQRSVSDEYTYCFDTETTLEELAVTTYSKRMLTKAYSSMKHRYFRLHQSGHALTELDNSFALRTSFVLMRFSYKSRACLMFADEYVKLSLYKRVLQYLRKIASPSAKLLRVASQVVGLTHKHMLKAISEKRHFWNDRVLPLLPLYSLACSPESNQSLSQVPEASYSSAHTTPYPTYLDTLSAIAPDEGGNSCLIDGGKKMVNLFERIVIQDRSLDAFTSLSSYGTDNDSFSTYPSTRCREFNPSLAQYKQDTIKLSQMTTQSRVRGITKDSYLTPFLNAKDTTQSLGCSSKAFLSSIQVQRLFDTTILIRNRLHKGQTLFYGASCAPIHLSSSRIDTLVKYQTFNIDSFSMENSINDYTLIEAAELFSLAFLQARALLAMRLALHRALLCSAYNSLLGRRSFAIFMLRRFQQCVHLQKTSELHMAKELSIRLTLRIVFQAMKKQIDREGQEWDDKSNSLFKFIVMRRQLKYWMALVQGRRCRLEQMTQILRELEKRLYLRPALTAMRTLHVQKQVETEVSERFREFQSMNLLKQAFRALHHRYRVNRALRNVVSQALPRWREVLEEEKRRGRTYRGETLQVIFSSWKELTFGGSFVKTAGFTDAPKALKPPSKALHFEGWSGTESSSLEELLDSQTKVKFTNDTRLYDGNTNGHTDMDKTLHFDLGSSDDEEHDSLKIAPKEGDLTLEDIGDDYWSIYSPQTAAELREAYRQVVPQLAKIQQKEECIIGAAEPLPTHHIEVLSRDNLAQLRNEVTRRFDRLERNSKITANEPTITDGSDDNRDIGERCTQALIKMDHTIEQQKKKVRQKAIRFADDPRKEDAVHAEPEMKPAYSDNDMSLTLDHHYTNNPTLRQAKIWYRRISCHICISYWRQHFIEMQLAKKFYRAFPGKRLLAGVFDEWATRTEMLATRHRRIDRLHVYLLKETCFLEWRYHAYIRRERAKQLKAEETRKEAMLLVKQIDKEEAIIASVQPSLKFPGFDSFVGQSKIIDPCKHNLGSQDSNRALTLRRIADEHYLLKIAAWIANRGILVSRERLLRAKLLAAEFSVPDSVIFQIPAKLDAWYLQEGFRALRESYKHRSVK